MLIDIHGHISTDTPATRVATYAGVANIDYVLISNRDAARVGDDARDWDEATANSATLAAAREHQRLRPLYWLRPGQVDSNIHAIAGALASEPFAGAQLAPAEVGVALSDGVLGAYLDTLALVEKPLAICIGNDNLTIPDDAYELARSHPRVPIVLCGCNASTERRNEMADVVRWTSQRNDADLYLDTSHATAPGIAAIVSAVGAERVLFGTNALSYDDTHLPRHIALIDELRATLSPADAETVLSQNAARIFGNPQSEGR